MIFSMEIHTIIVRDLEANPNSSNEKMEEKYISLDTPLATLISSAKSK